MINMCGKVNVLFMISVLPLLLSDFFQCVNCATKIKRTIYRHHVSPALGGKIPESAFHPHRLNNNLLSRNGIYSNDGVHLQQHYFKNTHGANDRYRPSTIKLYLPRNNKKVVPAGRYLAPEIIDTSYVLMENSPHFPIPKLRLTIHELPVVPQHSLEIKKMYEENNKEQNYDVDSEESKNAGYHDNYKQGYNNYQIARPQKLRQAEKEQQQDLSKVPGQAGVDYPLYHSVPETRFSCKDVPIVPGMYADVETGCQAYHICQEHQSSSAFLCANGTLFNQAEFACDWWYKVDCHQAQNLYRLNLEAGKNPYFPTPKPEDQLLIKAEY